MSRLKLRYSILLSVAAFALVIGGIGMISLNVGSGPPKAHAVESADEAARPIGNCFWMEDGYGNGSWICVPKIDALTAQLTPEHLGPSSPVMSNLQALSSEPLPGGGRPSVSNQPFTPHSQL